MVPHLLAWVYSVPATPPLPPPPVHGSPGAKGHSHHHEMLDLAKLIRQRCPSHTAVVPCRHKDGKLRVECDSTKSEHRMGCPAQGAGLLSLDFSLWRSWRRLAAFLRLTDGIARLPVALLPSDPIKAPCGGRRHTLATLNLPCQLGG